MDTEENSSSKEFHYTGDRLRRYLQRRGISYKEAAQILSIDKNTVGKAVRGGNLNVDILLHICNIFQMNVTDFFSCEAADENGIRQNYYIRSMLVKEDDECVSEGGFRYGKSEKIVAADFSVDEVIASVDLALSMLEKTFNDCRAQLEAMRQDAIESKNDANATLQ